MPIKKKLTGILFLILSCISNDSYAKKVNNKHPQIHICTRHDTARATLACAMYAEARGQGEHGMFSVGNVVLNRVDDSKHPPSIRKVVLQKDQFSYASNLPFKAEDVKSFNKALNISQDLLTMNKLAPDLRAVVDPTQGATFFKTKRIHPKWSRDKSIKLTYTYREHQFFKEE